MVALILYRRRRRRKELVRELTTENSRMGQGKTSRPYSPNPREAQGTSLEDRRRMRRTLTQIDGEHLAGGEGNGRRHGKPEGDKWELNPDQLEVYQEQKLGVGAYGAVFKGEYDKMKIV